MRIGLWMRAVRAPFFQAVIVPVLVGTVAAWYYTGQFHGGYLLAALFGAVFINAGTNLTNDYYDHRSGADELNREYTRFSGGSRVIQQGLLSPEAVIRAAVIFFVLAALIGLYLAYKRGPGLLLIGIAGIASGYFYTASPVRIGYRGWGEVITGIDCGPLVVLGAYYVQARSFDIRALLVSIPVGLLIMAILWVNQFADLRADRAAGKATLVVRMGPEKALKGFYLLCAMAYCVIILACALKMIPWQCCAAVLAVPLAWKAGQVARGAHMSGSGKKMEPAMAATVAAHLVTGLLLAGGYLAAGMMR